MPLVMLCGFPCSGKSTAAAKLAAHLRNTTKFAVEIISDSSLGLTYGQFDSSGTEKIARGAVKAATERLVDVGTVVIVDSLNYIKGYRYELYCIAKSLQTPSCVLHMATSDKVAAEWNAARAAGAGGNGGGAAVVEGGGGGAAVDAAPIVGYSSELHAALVQRFEMPDSRSRWDKPLFVVEPSEEVPIADITEVLLGKANGARNMATTSQPLVSSSLHDVDRITQKVVSQILKEQTNAMEGDKLIIDGHDEGLVLVRKVAMSELRRIRRQFTTYNKTHPIEDPARLIPAFISFVQSHLQ